MDDSFFLEWSFFVGSFFPSSGESRVGQRIFLALKNRSQMEGKMTKKEQKIINQLDDEYASVRNCRENRRIWLVGGLIIFVSVLYILATNTN